MYGFDEWLIGFKERDGIGRHVIEARQEHALKVVAQRFVHRLRKLGREADEIRADGGGHLLANRVEDRHLRIELRKHRRFS